MKWNVSFYRNESLTSENFSGVNEGLLNEGIHHCDISWSGNATSGYMLNLNSGLVLVFKASGRTTKVVLMEDSQFPLGRSLTTGDRVCIGYINDSAEPVVGLNLTVSGGYDSVLDVAVWNGSRLTNNGVLSHSRLMVGGSSLHSHYTESLNKLYSVGETYLADGEYITSGDGLYGWKWNAFGKETLDLGCNFSLNHLDASETNLGKLLAKACGQTFLNAVPCGFYPILYVEDGVGVFFSDLRDKLGADWCFSYSPVKNDNGTPKFGTSELFLLGGTVSSEFEGTVESALQSIVKSAVVSVPLTSTGEVSVTDSTFNVGSSTILLATPVSSDFNSAIGHGVYLKGGTGTTLKFNVSSVGTGNISFNVVSIY